MGIEEGYVVVSVLVHTYVKTRRVVVDNTTHENHNVMCKIIGRYALSFLSVHTHNKHLLLVALYSPLVYFTPAFK